MYRSDLETNPFSFPLPGTPFSEIPSKTAGGVFDTPLNPIWDEQVVPLVLASLKSHGIKHANLQMARFTTVENGNTTIGPIVTWIAVRPNTTNGETLRDVTPDILRILNDFQITGVVVEWYEGGSSSKLA